MIVHLSIVTFISFNVITIQTDFCSGVLVKKEKLFPRKTKKKNDLKSIKTIFNKQNGIVSRGCDFGSIKSV